MSITFTEEEVRQLDESRRMTINHLLSIIRFYECRGVDGVH